MFSKSQGFRGGKFSKFEQKEVMVGNTVENMMDYYQQSCLHIRLTSLMTTMILSKQDIEKGEMRILNSKITIRGC